MTYTESFKPAFDLIYLVSCAVNGEKPDKKICEKMELTEVLNTAVSHSLCVAAALSLEQIMTLPADFKEAKYKAVRRLSLMNVERERIFKAFEDKKISYAPLKGIVIKDCYPKTSMREMGDNDILCNKDRAEEIKDVMEGLGFVCKSFGKTHHDVYIKPPQLSFEIHRSLFDRANDPGYYEYFADVWDGLKKDEKNHFCYHMTSEDHYIFLLCHLFKHYKRKGTGLRSLLDVYVFFRKYGSCMDKKYLNSELQKLELVDFESTIRELAFKTITGQPLSKEENAELCFFIGSNTHGTKENYLTRQLQNDDSVTAKRRYAVSRLFPSKESLKKEHPFVYTHMGIYPLWILYRPIKGAVKYPKKMFGEITRLKNFKKKENTGKFNK